VGEFDFPVFVDQNAGARGDINIVNSVLPSFLPSESVSIPSGQAFPNISELAPNSNAGYTYYTSVVSTNDNPIISLQAEYTDYYGNVIIEGSTIVNGDWYPIIADVDLANVTETKGYVVRGYHPYIRMQFVSNAGIVTNILAR
jgi:hypothetical protein